MISKKRYFGLKLKIKDLGDLFKGLPRRYHPQTTSKYFEKPADIKNNYVIQKIDYCEV